MMRQGLILLILTVALASPTKVAAEQLTGPPTVLLGDVLEVAGTRLRLAGIDAPEAGQSCHLHGRTYDCGRISATALMDLTAGVEVRCDTHAARVDSLTTATCFADDYDLSEGMVYTGWALSDPRSGQRYRRLEAGAKEAKRGLWKGTFEPPWVWRARQAE